MKIDVLESNERVFRFTLKDAGPGFANAIRRAAINSVKTFAIDKITFYENTTAMFDEYIAHRIGLVPIKTPCEGLQRHGRDTIHARRNRPEDRILQRIWNHRTRR